MTGWFAYNNTRGKRRRIRLKGGKEFPGVIKTDDTFLCITKLFTSCSGGATYCH